MAKGRWLLALALGIAACSPIENSSRLVQRTDVPLIAGVGDTVVEIDTQESLPNAFGKADIFGRTRPTGRVTVVYLGMEQGRAVFERHTVRVISNATTMNSTPIVIPQNSTTTYAETTTASGMVPGGTFAGSAVSRGAATTTGAPIVLPPSGSQTQVISNDRVRYYLDVVQDRSLRIEGKEIVIEQVTPSSVSYMIRRGTN
jgi:hypothetical protein